MQRYTRCRCPLWEFSRIDLVWEPNSLSGMKPPGLNAVEMQDFQVFPSSTKLVLSGHWALRQALGKLCEVEIERLWEFSRIDLVWEPNSLSGMKPTGPNAVEMQGFQFLSSSTTTSPSIKFTQNAAIYSVSASALRVDLINSRDLFFLFLLFDGFYQNRCRLTLVS